MAQAGRLGQTVTINTRNGPRCFTCNTRQSTSKHHPGKTVFQPMFVKSSVCGIVSGCPGLQQMGAQGGGTTGFLQSLPGAGMLTR
jgi:hypothetical protein